VNLIKGDRRVGNRTTEIHLGPQSFEEENDSARRPTDCLAESGLAGSRHFGGGRRKAKKLKREVDLGIEQQVAYW
jgi:hypothetical protein